MTPDAPRIDTLCPSTQCLAFKVRKLEAALGIVPVGTIKDNAVSVRLRCDAARPEYHLPSSSSNRCLTATLTFAKLTAMLSKRLRWIGSHHVILSFQH